MGFTFYRQFNIMDCGPTCLRMIARHYGKHYSAGEIRQKAGFGKQGVSMLGLSEAAEALGFRTRGVKISFQRLEEVLLPCVLHWDQNHFIVLFHLTKRNARIADPGRGLITCTHAQLKTHWLSGDNEEGQATGVVLLLEPSPAFYEREGEKPTGLSWGRITRYLLPSRWLILQVFIALAVTSLLQLLFPFITRNVVDTGIDTKNIPFVAVLLIAQGMLTLSTASVDLIRSRVMLRISNVLNISILSDFWIKLTRLPISYFDSRHTGDTMQRLSDHSRIQSFLTGSTISTLFSLFNFVTYSVVLVLYSTQLFAVFAAGTALYLGWIKIFLQFRRRINYESFHYAAKENNATLQLIQGMHDIKLNNAEQEKRWEWENIQAGIFRLNIKSLNYSQVQQSGATVLNQVKDLAITFLVSKMVIEGRLTFGTMLAVQYIIGQLSGPIALLIGFIQAAQDARISMERLNEVHRMPDEEDPERNFIRDLPDDKGITLDKLSFAYPGSHNEPVLEDISLFIPEGRVTAIVGASGSGKTTLLKLLLKSYNPIRGEIRVGHNNLQYISPSFWRGQCGAVLQDGYIFNDSIAGNIAVRGETEDYQRLMECCKMVNILEFIESLPNGLYTKLGTEGVGISQGQRQRILIARAIYNNAPFLFFDEATNSLDASNEKTIVENLARVFKGRTVVVVAHRLSTVRDADNIVVLDKGRIVEQGTHAQLSRSGGTYYELVKNQLEFGN